MIKPEAAAVDKKGGKKDKELLIELDVQTKDIRLQLNEQLRCLDTRMETQVALVSELQDYFRRRSEVELDYSKNLDKLAKSLLLRHKEQKQKREQWHLFSSYSCWQQLINQTKKLSRDHAALSDIYANNVINRFTQVMEDTQRIYRRCREIGYETHEEILKVLHELHTAMKTYHTYQGECRQAETKLRYVESQRHKLEQSIPKEKLDKSKKFRLIEKEIQKRKNKYLDAKLKALKAKNEYVLCMDAANAAIHKYFVDDLSDIIDCMDFGFHHCVAQGLMTHNSAEENLKRSIQVGIENLNKWISNLDSRLDKQRFLEYNNSAFMIPKKFEFQPGQKGDELALQINEVDTQKCMQEELETRLVQLHKRLTSLRTESEEVWKTLETAEKSLLLMLNTKDHDCSLAFIDDDRPPPPKQPETISVKLRADKQETEDFYITKFREYTLGCNRISRLQAKYDHIRKVLGDDNKVASSPKMLRSAAVQNKPRRKRIGRNPLMGQPKLFGGSLEEFLEVTNQEIPLVMKSCIRVINLYGLHHQGIFRVSGSQLEINNFRESFERGEDPLADMTDASDINSVAGVLKLYLRELREPLFPIFYFDQFMELAQLESKHDFVTKMRDLVQSLPRSVFVVMRYLFAFLNHLSEFSDENMMDPYNLAICFGPTLVPIPEDKDQVQYQNLVNELIKNIIIFTEDIFPADGGIVYEKYISREPDEGDVGEAPADHVQDDMDSEVYPSEDDSVFREKDISLHIFGKSETLEATAQFDFVARSERELGFKKGDNIVLFSQVSNDWWRGSVGGKEGLIPDKYILLKIRDEDREKLDSLKSCSSEESVRRRTSSSSDSLLSSHSSHKSQPPPTLPEEGTSSNCCPPLSLPPAIINHQPEHHRRHCSDSTAYSQTEGGGSGCGAGQKGAWQPVSAEHLANLSTPPVIVTAKPATARSECSDSCSADFISSDEVTRSPSPCTPSFEKSASASELPKETGLKSCRSTNSLHHSTGESPPSTNAEESHMDQEPSKQQAQGNLDGALEQVVNAAKKLASSAQSEAEESAEPAGNSSSESSAPFHMTRSLTEIESSMGRGVLRRAWETRSVCDLDSTGDTNEEESFVHKRDVWEKRTTPPPASLSSAAPMPTTPSTPPTHTKSKSEDLNSTTYEMWSAASSNPTGFRNNRDFWEQRAKMRQKHTPDLVMDLPVSPITKDNALSKDSSSSGSSSSSPSPGSSPGPESPDMTAAERFAKQNQCTLKKNSRAPPVVAPAVDAQTQTKKNDKESPVQSEMVPVTPGTPKTPAKFGQLAMVQTPQVSSFKPQVKVKPQVLRKPMLPPAAMAELAQRNEGKNNSSGAAEVKNTQF